MAWTAPMTALPGTILTAAQWNMFVRDNLNETAAAKATTVGRYFVTTGPHRIAQRASSQDVISTSETTTSTGYTELATPGPEVTMTTGTHAVVFIRALVSNNTNSSTSIISFGVSGATEIDPADFRGAFIETGAANQDSTVSACTRFAVTPGVNTFTMFYRVGNGTGSFEDRRLLVFGL